MILKRLAAVFTEAYNSMADFFYDAVGDLGADDVAGALGITREQLENTLGDQGLTWKEFCERSREERYGENGELTAREVSEKLGGKTGDEGCCVLGQSTVFIDGNDVIAGEADSPEFVFTPRDGALLVSEARVPENSSVPAALAAFFEGAELLRVSG